MTPARRTTRQALTVAEHYGAHDQRGPTAPPRDLCAVVRRYCSEVFEGERDERPGDGVWRQRDRTNAAGSVIGVRWVRDGGGGCE